MTEQEIREIIRDELDLLIKSDRFTFYKLIQILDGRNIQLANNVGSKIGTDTTQKLGFWAKNPTTQPSVISDPSGQANDLDSEARTAINSIIDLLQSIGLMGT